MTVSEMTLPFSPGEFLAVFAQFNRALWPAALVLWCAAAGVVLASQWRPRPTVDRTASVVVAVLWALGAVYHAVFFATINPVAWAFALMFAVEAGALAWFGLVRRQLAFAGASRGSRTIGAGLGLYALAYPGVNLLLGHGYPELPTFGVPCPTTILTVGLMMRMGRRPPAALIVIPVLWALIGGSAAVLLGMTADYVLLACAPLLVADVAIKPGMPAV